MNPWPPSSSQQQQQSLQHQLQPNQLQQPHHNQQQPLSLQQQQPPETALLPASSSTNITACSVASVQQGTADCRLPLQQDRQRRDGGPSHLPSRVTNQQHQYQRYQPYLHQHHHHHQQQQQQQQYPRAPLDVFADPVPGPSSGYPYPNAPPQYYREYQGPPYSNSHGQTQPSSSPSPSSSNNAFVSNYQYFQYFQQCQAAAAAQQQYHFDGYQQPSTHQPLPYQQYQPIHPPQEQLSTLEGVQSGVPTLTTPTLTPTTLRNIQNTFLQASQQPQPPETHTNQAGFVPPFVHPQPGSTFISIDSKSLGGGIATLVDTSSYSSVPDDSGANLAKTSSGPPPLLPISNILTTAPSSVPLPGPPIPTIISTAPPSTSPMPSVSHSVCSSDSDTLSLDVPPSRRMGGRRPNNHEKLSDEEEIKRRVRRERNKMAAARCRKRRLDQTMTLQEETDQLSEKRSALQQEVTVLTQQKEELEFLLATHKAVCTKASRTRVPPAPASSVIVTTSSRAGTQTVNASALPVTEAMFIGHNKSYMVPSSSAEMHHVRVKEENLSDSEDPYSSSLFSSIIPTTSSMSHAMTYSSSMPPSTLGSARSQVGGRPTRPTSLAVAPLTELGVAIETPSAGLRGLNFESMMEGGTGLTPVTPLPGGMPATLSTGLTPLTTPIMAHPSASSSNNNNNSITQCGYQQRSSSSELSSPDSMSSKQLVSL